MTLSAAKNYFSAYGVHIQGNTKQAFIRELCKQAATSKD
jgi:hypothetical protein